MVALEKMTVGNAAGVVGLHNFNEMLRSAATHITVVVTLLKRRGNISMYPGDPYYYDEQTGNSLNSMGLPNLGMDDWARRLPEMITAAHRADKKLFVSIAGFSKKEFIQIAKPLWALGVDGIKLNLACPNIHVEGARKPIFCHSPSVVEEILADFGVPLAMYSVAATQAVAEVARKVFKEDAAPIRFGKPQREILVKLSPTNALGTLLDFDLLSEIADVIRRSGVVSGVACFNTIPDQMMYIEDEKGIYKPALAFKSKEGDEKVLHTGGLAGEELREVALEGTLFMRNKLPDLRIITAGGIKKAQNIEDARQRGADGFECGTAVMQRGPRVFSEMLQEYAGHSAESLTGIAL